MNRLQDVKASVGNFRSGAEVKNISWTINTRDSKHILDNKLRLVGILRWEKTLAIN